jgi:hypothetical protein
LYWEKRENKDKMNTFDNKTGLKKVKIVSNDLPKMTRECILLLSSKQK